MKFIDLFAGLGGFHVALTQLDHECVFASEKDEKLKKLYKENFEIDCYGDITKITASHIPDHDILCGGFPCQPFSKAGRQNGFNDTGRGDLIDDIVKILKAKKPKFFILENVPNLRQHDREETWKLIQKKLSDARYDVKEEVLSPHDFGIPQIRKRIFIVGVRKPSTLDNFHFPIPTKEKVSIDTILDKNPEKSVKLIPKQIECLALWQRILDAIAPEVKLPGFPIWGMEYGATYPISGKSPHSLTSKELGKYKGAFGASLKGLKKSEQIELLPSYARYKEYSFPKWKTIYLTRIRKFLKDNSKDIGNLLLELKKYPPSWQKLEWNCGESERNISNYLLQFRASGIRVKKTDYAPALVLSSTQIPIVGWESRYITLKEASRLQGLDGITLPDTSASAYRALGNAVTVKLVYLIAKNLLASQDTVHNIIPVQPRTTNVIPSAPVISSRRVAAPH
jgi:DNA (cytosine-5)-methyltransferase 1